MITKRSRCPPNKILLKKNFKGKLIETNSQSSFCFRHFVTSDIPWSLRTYKCRACMRSQEAKWDRLDLFSAFHRQCEQKKYLKICSFKFDETWQKSYSYRAYVNKSLKIKVSPSSYFIENFKKTFVTICF